MTARERQALVSLATPPLGAVEWAETYRRIPRKGNPEPGRYSLDRTPYWREPLEAADPSDPHDWVTVMKTPQVGYSEFARTVIGRWLDVAADDVLLVYPTQDSCEEQIMERVVPMIRETPRLARWLTGRVHDVRQDQVSLLHATVWAGWAGSPQTMSSRPVPRVVLDETDKFAGSSKEAPPEEFVKHRTTAYKHRRKILAGSTPTVKTGTIYRMWRKTRDRRLWWCACPCCGELVLWSWEAFRWDRRGTYDEDDEEPVMALIDELETGAARAWVECASCRGEIHEARRLDAVAAGEWVSEGHRPGERPKSRRVAYHVPSWISPWVSFAQVVVGYLEARLGGNLHDFHNGFLGLPAEEITGTISASVLEERAQGRSHVVPPWATVVVAGADTQVSEGKPYWVYVVRAWGKGNRSKLIDYGKAHTPQELKERTVFGSFAREGLPAVGASVLLVDSGGAAETVDGSTTHLVYEMARRDPARVVAIKGASHAQDRLIRASNVAYSPPGSPHKASVHLHTLDTERLKDLAASLIRATEPVMWEECAIVTPDYVAQMTAEEKTRTRVGRKVVTKWVKTSRARNDLWDASVYSLAGAIMARAADRAEAREARKAAPAKQSKDKPERRASRRGGSKFGARIKRDGGWVSRRRR